MAYRYILPFVLYLVGTQLASQWMDYYPWAYAGVVFLTVLVTWWLHRGQTILVPHRHVLAAVATGIIGIVIWIGLSELKLEAWLASALPAWLQPAPRTGYNPWEQLSHPLAVWGFISVRLLGLAVLVPVVEEIFWRGFLARWLVRADWEQVRLGQFTPFSFLGVVFLFATAHPEWLAATIYCALLNGLLMWKHDLWNCVVAHSVSNLILGAYVLSTEAWWLW